MDKERERILKLLEEGKITADQAARLIEALGQRQSEPKFIHFNRTARRVRSLHELDRIPEIVAEAVGAAVRSGFESSKEVMREFTDTDDLFIKTVSGDVFVNGWDEKKVSLRYGCSMVKVKELSKRLLVSSFEGDVSTNVPRDVRLELLTVAGDITVKATGRGVTFRTVSGDIAATQAQGPFIIRTVAGDINLSQCSGKVELKSKSGNVNLIQNGDLSGWIETHSGDVRLGIRANTDALLQLASEEGEFHTDITFPYEVVEQKANKMTVKFGAGTCRLTIRTGSGAIEIKEEK